MKDRFNPLIFVVILLVFQCNTSNNSNTNFKSKIYSFQQEQWEANEITQFVDNINYTASEVPLQYYLFKNSNRNDLSKIDSLYQVHKRERIIEFEFQHLDKKDLLLEEFSNRPYEEAVKYLSFQISNDFKVVTSSGDTIKCSGSLFERNFKVAPFKRALLYFNNINPADNIQLLYQDRLFGNGMIKFNFKETPLKL